MKSEHTREMKNSTYLPAFVLQFLLALLALASSIRTVGADDLPAFPGAEGFGANTLGGRGGKVIFVTNLDDSGPGSFRAACEAEGPRLVLFRVAGTIALKRPGMGFEVRVNWLTGGVDIVSQKLL